MTGKNNIGRQNGGATKNSPSSKKNKSLAEIMLDAADDSEVEHDESGKAKLPVFDTTEISLAQHISVMIINARHGDKHEPLHDLSALTGTYYICMHVCLYR